MPYILITEDGRFMEFYLAEVAALYKAIHGGAVVKISELLNKTAGKKDLFEHPSDTRTEYFLDKY